LAKRQREQRIFFRVSEQELTLISDRMKLIGIQNREAYLRKMAIDGYILNLDLSDIQKMIRLLSNATNNLNQIAKRVNISQNIYKNDIKDLQEKYNELWETAKEILNKFLEI